MFRHFIVVGLVVLFVRISFGQDTSNMVMDYYDEPTYWQTVATVIGKGNVQARFDYYHTWAEKNSNYSWRYSDIEFLMRVGLGKTTELNIGIGDTESIYSEEGEKDRLNSWNPAVFSIKQSLFIKENTFQRVQFAFEGGFQIPLVKQKPNDALSDGNQIYIAPQLFSYFSQEIGNCNLEYTLGMVWDGYEEKPTIVYSFLPSYGDLVSIWAEYYSEVKRNEWPYQEVLAGLTFGVTRNGMLDVWASKGLNKQSNNWVVGASFAYRFRNPI